MVLFPMHDAGQRRIVYQLLKRNHHSRRAKTDMFRCIADTQHRNSFARNKRLLAEGFQTVVPAVVLGYHAQAGGTAVHGIELGVGGEGEH